MKKTVIFGSIFFVVVAVIVVFVMRIHFQNEEVRVRHAIEAKIDVNKSHYTKMFEILTQEAGVTDEYVKQFKEIIPMIVEGRYKNGAGQLMMWIQEDNPEFDSGLYQNLMKAIEAQRESFHTTQEQLRDLKREHDNLLETAPSRWFVGDREPIEVPIIINDETDEAFSTGKEVEMNLFD